MRQILPCAATTRKRQLDRNALSQFRMKKLTDVALEPVQRVKVLT